jgi:hypothetical protein
MNERIQQLMEQAGLYDFVIKSMGIDEEMEKFAELIVRECIAQAVKEEERYDSLNGRDCDYCSMAMSNFQGVLAEHFGVEE